MNVETQNACEAALQDLTHGRHSIPIPYKSKIPALKGWQKLRLATPEEVRQHFNGTEINRGLLTGQASGGLFDVDLDSREAQFVASLILPPTRLISGRFSMPLSHWWYLDPQGKLGTKRFKDPSFEDGDDERACLCELRGDGSQTVVFPSLHPSGEVVVWHLYEEPAAVQIAELLRLVSRIAASALLARYWAGEGSRHDMSLPLAGFLLRHGMAEEDAKNFVEITARAAGDDDIRNRVKSVIDTASKIRNNENTTGGPTLKELLTADPTKVDKVLEKVLEWLDLEPEKKKFVRPAHWRRLDLAKLEEWKSKELTPVVDGWLAQGNLAIVAAASQTGKTLFLQWLERQLVEGGKLFDRYSITPPKKIYHLVLEDTDTRIEERERDIGRAFKALPAPERIILDIAPGFALNDSAMFAYLRSLIREEACDVLVIDTYQKATPGLSSFKDEEQSLILHQLSNLTRELKVLIIVLDHIRKEDKSRKRGELTLDDIKGTGGKVQNADCVILLERSDKEGRFLKLQVFSKDFDELVGLLLERAPKGSSEQKFKLVGDLKDFGSKAKGKTDQKQMELLNRMVPGQKMRMAELKKVTGWHQTTISRHLKPLIGDGKVKKDGKNRSTTYTRLMQDAFASVSIGEQEVSSSERVN
jgi:hypothetical protein